MKHWADYLIFVGVLLISVGIGIYHALTGGKQRTNEEFIMADRKLKLVPAGISLFVSYTSVLTMIGAPAEMYTYGIAAWPGIVITTVFACILISRLFVPWLYPLKLTSINGYIWMRYKSRAIQMIATSLSLILSVTYTAVAIFAPSLAMEAASGLSPSITIPVLTIVCASYTTLGGIKAVIWTDVFQFLVMMAGILTVFGKAVMMSGGLSQTFSAMVSTGRASISISMDPTERHTIWGFLIGHTILITGYLGFQQSTIQRYSALPTLAAAKKIPYMLMLGFLVVYTVCFFTGIALFGYYHNQKCDPLASGQIHNANQLVSLFTATVFRDVPGFSGLFTATLFSATLSTASSALSGAAAITWDDIMVHRFPGLSERRAVICSKILVATYGAISLALAFGIANMSGPVLQIAMSVVGICLGPFTGMFLCAGCRILRWIRWQFVAMGSVVSFAIGLWMQIGAVTLTTPGYPDPPPLSITGCGLGSNQTRTMEWTNYTETYIQESTSTIDPPITDGYGLKSFYMVSYLWKMPIGIACTILIAVLLGLAELLWRKVSRGSDVQEGDRPLSHDATVVPAEMFIKWKTLFCCNKSTSSEAKEPRELIDVKTQLMTGVPADC